VQQRIDLTARQIDGQRVAIYIEREPGAAGLDVIALYQRLLRGFAVREDRATGHKLTRIDPFLAAAEAGNVVLVRKRYIGNGVGVGQDPATWHAAFLTEADEFTGDESTHDDQIIAAAGCFNRAAMQRSAVQSGPVHGI
jgi:phage terminase large subunit-like protein